MSGARAWSRLVAGALALLFAPDCTTGAGGAEIGAETADEGDGGGGASGQGGDGAGQMQGPVLSAAVWTLTFDTDGVTFPETGGLDVETDLGYRVHVHTARILSHNLSFGPCETSSGAGTGAGSSAEASGEEARWWLPVRSAHAHTADVDPSMIETSLVEDLVAAATTEVASSFAAARYCRAHWLVARPLAATKGPADVAMADRSLFVTGTFERGGERRPFTIDTWWPDGLLVDLAEAAETRAFAEASEDAEPRHAFVTITRHLGGLFDGVDFDAASDDQITGTVIGNLVSGAGVHVELWSPGDSG